MPIVTFWHALRVELSPHTQIDRSPVKISIANFKAIREIQDYSLDKINVLTGINSGGKSSLIHLLLLIKQSLEFRSSETPLKLNRPYVSLGKFENILRKGESAKSISVTFKLSSGELLPRLRRVIGQKGLQSASPCTITVEFTKPSDRIVVGLFKIEFDIVKDSEQSSVIEKAWLKVVRNGHGKSYQIQTNNQDLFFLRENEVEAFSNNESIQVGFFSFFPDYFSTEDASYVGSFLIDQARLSLQKVFSGMSYIGPLREEPRDFYFQDDDQIDHIGNKGENAAYILAKHAKDIARYTRFIRNDDGTILDTEIVEEPLEDALTYWLCSVFNLGREIYVETSKGNRYLYTVSLVGNDGVKVPITHVGFGVSQIFPILVEGLRPSHSNRLVILEQPEIHLHPRVQSLLFDFMLSTKDNVSFLIETHSDHLVTRLRRRVAESDANSRILQDINLTFVEPGIGGVEYTKLNIDQVGRIDDWPDGFFDQYESELRALVTAQLSKKKTIRQ